MYSKKRLKYLKLTWLCSHLPRLAALGILLPTADPIRAQYQENWSSLASHPDPAWFDKGKFGIYAHWGPYSVPAFQSEWYPHNMYLPGSKANAYHLGKYGALGKFGYKDFIPLFTAPKFDADAWAALYRKAGAKFAGPVAEHADGFSMWDSKLTDWNAMRMGPHRDIVGEMERAIRAQGLKFITTFHHQWLWGWYPTWDPAADVSDPRYAGLYGPATVAGAWSNNPLPTPAFQRQWVDKVDEVVDKYHPDLLWFDSRMYILDEAKRREMLAHYYNAADNRGQVVGATYKDKDFSAGAGIVDYERGGRSGKSQTKWLTDDSMDKGSWSWVEPPNLVTANHIIDELADIVSKNGNLLLNIPPKADGEIDASVQNTLLAVGDWLGINGEAIYGTRPWKTYGEGPTLVNQGSFGSSPNFTAQDIRFTAKGRTLYATVLGWPKASQLTIASLKRDSPFLLGKAITSIELLGGASPSPMAWATDAAGTRIALPAQPPGPEYAYTFRIRFDGDALGFLDWENPWDRETWTAGEKTLQWTRGGAGGGSVRLEYAAADDMRPVPVLKASASSQFGSGFEAGMACDGSLATHWASQAGRYTDQWLELDFAGPQAFNRAVIREATDFGFTIAAYGIQYWTGSAWSEVASGTQVGPFRAHDFPTVTASRVRLYIAAASNINISELEFYRPALRIDETPNTGSYLWKPVGALPDSVRLRVRSLDGQTEAISAVIRVTGSGSMLQPRGNGATAAWTEGGLTLAVPGRVAWKLPYGGPGELTLYDMQGKLVWRTRVTGPRAVWEGPDGHGGKPPDGTCFWKMAAAGKSRSGMAAFAPEGRK